MGSNSEATEGSSGIWTQIIKLVCASWRQKKHRQVNSHDNSYSLQTQRVTHPSTSISIFISILYWKSLNPSTPLKFLATLLSVVSRFWGLHNIPFIGVTKTRYCRPTSANRPEITRRPRIFTGGTSAMVIWKTITHRTPCTFSKQKASPDSMLPWEGTYSTFSFNSSFLQFTVKICLVAGTVIFCFVFESLSSTISKDLSRNGNTNKHKCSKSFPSSLPPINALLNFSLNLAKEIVLRVLSSSSNTYSDATVCSTSPLAYK